MSTMINRADVCISLRGTNMTGITAVVIVSFLTRELRKQVTGSSGGYDYANWGWYITLRRRQGKAPVRKRFSFVCQHCLTALVNSF